eukprot:5742273-Alexandrium_andersonii.AAC.1
MGSGNWQRGLQWHRSDGSMRCGAAVMNEWAVAGGKHVWWQHGPWRVASMGGAWQAWAAAAWAVAAWTAAAWA